MLGFQDLRMLSDSQNQYANFKKKKC